MEPGPHANVALLADCMLLFFFLPFSLDYICDLLFCRCAHLDSCMHQIVDFSPFTISSDILTPLFSAFTYHARGCVCASSTHNSGV